jgi:hypothetical protein
MLNSVRSIDRPLQDLAVYVIAVAVFGFLAQKSKDRIGRKSRLAARMRNLAFIPKDRHRPPSMSMWRSMRVMTPGRPTTEKDRAWKLKA